MSDDDREPPGLDEERRRRFGRFFTWAQIGGLVFLAVISIGLLPRALAAISPALGQALALPATLIGIAIPLVLLVVAAIRLGR